MSLSLALDHALREVERARESNWHLPNGQSAAPLLDRLAADLAAARRGELSSFSGLARWVTDWAPDLRDPLVLAVAELERQSALEVLSP